MNKNYRKLMMMVPLALTFALLISVGLHGLGLAAVWTDLPDYSPGSVVTISGDSSDGIGFNPGEIVHVDVAGPNGYTASCDTFAADDGSWSCQVTLWETSPRHELPAGLDPGLRRINRSFSPAARC